jgi:Lon protease-like protein
MPYTIDTYQPGMPKPKLIALFPVPGFMAMPGMVSEFHVFEPRYRAMVEASIKEVCANPLSEPVEWGVCSFNPLTYKRMQRPSLVRHPAAPQNFFCTGPMQILKKHADGRYDIKIAFDKKVRLLNLAQSVPFLTGHVAEQPEYIENAANVHQDLCILRDILNQFADMGLAELRSTKKIKNNALIKQFYDFLALTLKWVQLDPQDCLELLGENCIDHKLDQVIRILTDVYDSVEDDLMNLMSHSERQLLSQQAILARKGNVLHVDFHNT